MQMCFLLKKKKKNKKQKNKKTFSFSIELLINMRLKWSTLINLNQIIILLEFVFGFKKCMNIMWIDSRVDEFFEILKSFFFLFAPTYGQVVVNVTGGLHRLHRSPAMGDVGGLSVP